MATKSKLPPISTQLLAALEKAFPDVLPHRDTTLDELRIKQGEINVLRFLRHQYDIQNTTTLPGT